jgi:RNA polymerase sigma-70 factor (ECF subfamily)
VAAPRSFCREGFGEFLHRIARVRHLDARAMQSEPLPTADLLTSHVQWIRSLARQLVADAVQADDLAQETCVVALSHAPREAGRLRGWLASVMRNLARQHGRSDGRRRAREEFAARSEVGETTDTAVERIAVQRELVEAVLELGEPYREAILLRFFEELPPREIARRLDAPVATVQSRITRGLAELRQRLDRAHGERRSWLMLLLPFADTPRSAAPTLGTWIVNAKATLAIVSIVAIATVAAVASLRSDEPSTSALASAESASPALSTESAPLQSTLSESATRPASNERAVLPVAPKVASDATNAAPDATPMVRTVRGRVIDAQGVPLAGVDVATRDTTSPQRTRSAAGGWFELKTELTVLELEPVSDAWTSVRNGSWLASSAIDPLVIVAPAIDVGGTVLDAQRQPLSNARVSLALPRGFETRFTDNLEATQILGWRAQTDADGRFTIARAPQVSGATLTVVADGFQSQSQAEPEASDLDLLFVLARPAAPLAGALRGRVLNEAGAPVADARVSLGLTSTLSGPDGEFAVNLARAVTADRVTAVKLGFRPASLDRPQEPSANGNGWPDFVELRLGGAALSITGRVVDSTGKPRPKLRLWIADPTPFGNIGRVPVQLENLMAGARVPPEIVGTEPPPDAQDGDNFNDHFTSVGPSTAYWTWVPTDDEGRFRIDGLDERRYKLRMMDDATLSVFTSDPISAGSRDVKIEMPDAPVYPRIAGRVLSSRGKPIAGVQIVLRREAFGSRTRVFGGTAQYGMIQLRESATTNAEGRFEFKDVPREGVALDLRHDGIVPRDFALEGVTQPENLDVVVDARCRLELRLKPPIARADRMAVRDGDGRRIDVMLITQGSVNAYTDVGLVEGRSGVVSVSSAARTLVLLDGEKVVETHAIDLVEDQINVLEL